MRMEQILILLVMLAVGTYAVVPVAETTCNANKSISWCPVAVGGSVYIQVMHNASGHMVSFKKKIGSELKTVFKLKNEKITPQNVLNNTQFFIHNGTLKLSNVQKNDSGEYVIDIHIQNGMFLKSVTVHLDVQDTSPDRTFIWIIAGSAAGGLLVVVLIFVCICHMKSGKRKKTTTMEDYI